LWVLLAIVALAVIALARQVGLLTLRVRPVGSGWMEEGPALGQVVTIPGVSTLRGRRARVLSERHIGIVLFVSTSCGLCKPVLAGAARLQLVESDLIFTVAVDADGEAGLEYLEKHGFADGVAASDLPMLDSGNRPFAVAVNSQGVVLAAGAVNTLDQLEGLADLARDRDAVQESGVELADDDDQRMDGELLAQERAVSPTEAR
jgi:hypothetical protein